MKKTLDERMNWLNIHKKIRDFKYEMRNKEPQFVREARTRYLRDEVEMRGRELARRRLIAGNLILQAKSEDQRKFRECLFDDSEYERGINRMRNEIKHREAPQTPGMISAGDIERARSHPLFELLGLCPGNRVNCPWHDDHKKTFALYADGKGHCFSCNSTHDAIAWIMKTEGLSFHAAVRLLA